MLFAKVTILFDFPKLVLLIQLLFQQPEAGLEFFYSRQLLLNLLDMNIGIGCDSDRCSSCDCSWRVLWGCFFAIAAKKRVDMGEILAAVASGSISVADFLQSRRSGPERSEVESPRRVSFLHQAIPA